MDNLAEQVKNKALAPQKEAAQLLYCIAKQNEDLIEIQTQKVDILQSIDGRDEKVMLMYKRKNFVSSIFGLFGLLLTAINIWLVAIGIMYLPEETQLLIDKVLTMVIP